ncbi:MAG: hypothetical protein IT313_06580 [Anaerolineales bacterium]|nr:hypothetical protein [Anaerolineales bacterium]
MSRILKVLLVVSVVTFTLACSLVTNPINDVKNTANTAQAFATEAIGLATAMPLETLGAIPTQLSQFGNYFDPQGTPVAEWNGIPIMSQATAGQEFDANNYSFKFSGTVKEAVDFYTAALSGTGWSPVITVPGDEQFSSLIYQRESGILTVSITNTDSAGAIVVWFALAQ